MGSASEWATGYPVASGVRVLVYKCLFTGMSGDMHMGWEIVGKLRGPLWCACMHRRSLKGEA